MIFKLKKSELVRNVVVLMTGTVLAQFFSIILTPIISRLYNEDDMADLGMFIRIISFVSAVATVRFELALPIPKSNNHSFLLYRLSLRIAAIIMFLCFIIGLIYISFTSLASFWFVLLSIVTSYFFVFINLGTNWSIRHKHFKSISTQRIVNSLSTNGFKLIFGLLHLGSLGLVLGTFLGYFLSSFKFIKDFLNNIKLNENKYSTKKINSLVREYRRFPLISLPHVLIDLGRDLLIAFLIVFFYGKHLFGHYVYAIMILSIPISVIGNSVGQVFFNKCTELINGKKILSELLLKTFKSLFLISILPFGILFFYGENIFEIVLGLKWKEAGKFSEIMTIWMMVNFIISPISNLPTILKKQKQNFIIGLLGTLMQLFIVGILPFYIGSTLNDFKMILWILTLSQVFILFISGLFYFNLAKQHDSLLLVENSI